VYLYFTSKPTKAEIRKELRKEGSRRLDDFGDPVEI
jgi:hypothetical protein